MSTESRKIFKSLTWRATATITTITLVYIATGKLDLALKLGFVEVFLKIMIYYLHETIWDKFAWGKVSENQCKKRLYYKSAVPQSDE